jgi:hypothetical protein
MWSWIALVSPPDCPWMADSLVCLSWSLAVMTQPVVSMGDDWSHRFPASIPLNLGLNDMSIFVYCFLHHLVMSVIPNLIS